ncbi:MAG: Xyloglucanase [Owenweeksia sp. TMED14]|nr:MAG: Xyloglucanase [Owenweeksia sp. TMED14]
MKKHRILSLLLITFPYFLSAQISEKVLEDLSFRNIGPAGMSGRVTSIDVDPTNSDMIYAGTASGGVWRSENAGQSWNSIWDNQPTSGIGVVKLDPNNSDIIWVGTGEGNPRNSQSSGGGLFKSIDGGKSFELLGLEKTKHIHKIVIDPRNSDIVYIAAFGVAWGDTKERGVYKTIDGGKTWKKILYNNERTGAADLIIDPSNPNKLFCAMWEYRRWPWFFKSGGKGSGLYVTLDGGENWKKISEEDGLPKGELGRIGLAIAKSNSKVVYALVENKEKNGLYKSIDGGFKWEMVSEDEKIGNRPFYYSDLHVDPFNENTIYSLWTLVTRSDDGGKSWRVITPYSKVHPDHHALWMDPKKPGHLIEGNDGGINITWDGGSSWRFIENLPIAQFYHISVDNQKPYNVYGGMQDNGSWKGPAYSWKGTGIGNSEWQELYFGDGFDVVPHPSDPRIVYAMAQEGYLGRIDTRTGGAELIKPVHPEGDALRWHWNSAIAQDPFNEDAIFYGSQYVHYSKDQGRNWSILSPDLTTNNPEKQKSLESGGLTFDVTGAENHTCIISIAPSPIKSGLIWVGTDDGNIQLSKDFGDSWTNFSSNIKGFPEGAWVAQIQASKHNEGEAFIVVNNYRQNDWKPYLYHTNNYGKSWKNIVGKSSVKGHSLSVIQDPTLPNLLYLGTETGLYISGDYGSNWQKWKGLPTMPVQDMAIQERESDLILGTFGRAAWVLDDLRSLRAIVSEKNKGRALTAFKSPEAVHAEYMVSDGIRFQGDASFKGDNRRRGARMRIYLDSIPEETKDPLKIDIYDSSGILIRHIERKLKNENSGLYSFVWDMCEKGVRGPRFGKTKADRKKSDPSGSSVKPGIYKVVFSFKDHSDSTLVSVIDDPRINMDLQEWEAQLTFQRSLHAPTKELATAVERLYDVKESLDAFEKLLKLRTANDSNLFKPILSEIKAFKKKIEEERLALFGKENVKGYFEQPETWAHINGKFGSYLWQMRGKPTTNLLAIHNLWLEKTTEATIRVQEMLNNDWLALSEQFKTELPVQIFPE